MTIHYAGKTTDGTTFLSSREVVIPREQSLTMRELSRETAPGPMTFTRGDGSVVPAWDKVVGTMVPGEICTVVAAAHHAYGDNGAAHLGVAPGTPVLFELELLEWKQPIKSRAGMAAKERMDEATALKTRGTDAFKAASYPSAMELYDHGSYYLADSFLMGAYLEDLDQGALLGGGAEAGPTARPEGGRLLFEGVEADAQALFVSCLLNAAMCALKRRRWRDAESRCNKVRRLREPHRPPGARAHAPPWQESAAQDGPPNITLPPPHCVISPPAPRCYSSSRRT